MPEPTGQSGPQSNPFLDTLQKQAAIMLTNNIGPNQNGRIPNKIFQENEARANITNTNNVDRYNDFTTGILDTQAANYNSYQDQTFGQDTQRGIDRINAEATGLGMSPWELKGQAGASPDPSPTFNSGGAESGNPGGQGMQLAAQMQIAQLQAKTQMGQALINSETARDVAKINTGNARAIADQQTAGGEVGKTTVAKNTAERLYTEAQTGLVALQRSQTEAVTGEANQRTKESAARTAREQLGKTLDIIRTAKDLQPNVKAKTPFGEVEGKANSSLLMRLLDQNTEAKNLAALSDQDVEGALKEAAKLAHQGNKGMTGITDTVGSLLNNKWPDWMKDQ